MTLFVNYNYNRQYLECVCRIVAKEVVQAPNFHRFSIFFVDCCGTQMAFVLASKKCTVEMKLDPKLSIFHSKQKFFLQCGLQQVN